MPDGLVWVFHKLLIYWDFHTQPSLGFTENGPKNRKYPVSGRQICSNCVMLSCQYGPRSLRNVSNTLLNPCHEELTQFWRQKWVQPGTSTVYLIKWPVYIFYYGKWELSDLTAVFLHLSRQPPTPSTFKTSHRASQTSLKAQDCRGSMKTLHGSFWCFRDKKCYSDVFLKTLSFWIHLAVQHC